MIREAFHYGFVEMMDDLAFWIVFGIVLTGFLSATLPNDFFERVVGNPTVEMVVMLLVGIPLYLCATSSTPLAAALMAKGLSPGAGLVFLLAGPVTNIGTLMIVGRVFGGRFLRIYLLSIIIVCMTLGMATNAFFSADQFTLWSQEGDSSSMAGVVLRFIGLLAFIVLAGASFQRTGFRKDIAELWHHLQTFVRWLKEFKPGHDLPPAQFLHHGTADRGPLSLPGVLPRPPGGGGDGAPVRRPGPQFAAPGPALLPALALCPFRDLPHRGNPPGLQRLPGHGGRSAARGLRAAG